MSRKSETPLKLENTLTETKTKRQRTATSSGAKAAKKKESTDTIAHASPEAVAAGTIASQDNEPAEPVKGAASEGSDKIPAELPKVTPSTRVIQTPEDAVMAYLREEIDEEEFRSLYVTLGGTAGSIKLPDDRAFNRDIPDWVKADNTSPYDDVGYAKEVADAKQKVREAAAEASKKVAYDHNLSAEANAQRQNEAAAEAARKALS